MNRAYYSNIIGFLSGNDLPDLVLQLHLKSQDLGYWTAIWESTSSGVGLSTEDLNKLRIEVEELHSKIKCIIGSQ